MKPSDPAASVKIGSPCTVSLSWHGVIGTKVITHLVAAASGFWTACIHAFAHDRNDWPAWGVYDGFHIFGGHYWSLFTSVFVHRDLMHIAFNLYWLIVLGGWMEEKYGGRFYAIFLAACAFCSSATELSAIGETGVGLSGVVYGIFGFLWGRQLLGKEFIEVVDRDRVRLFVGWLVLCFVLTWANVMLVANGAHLTGLVFGLAMAVRRSRLSWWPRAIAPAMVLLAVTILAYSPWNAAWLARKAYDARVQGRLAESADYLSRMLVVSPDDRWAKDNLSEVREALAKARRTD